MKINYSTKSRKFHHLTQVQRGQIQAMLGLKVPKVQIAIIVGISAQPGLLMLIMLTFQHFCLDTKNQTT